MSEPVISASAPLAVESLSVITYQSRPVVTTELLAQLYGTDTDNHLTLDTAKELAMVEANAKGRQVRRYFIA